MKDNSIKFEELDGNLQERIKDYLMAYDDVRVYYEEGEYHFGTLLKAEYEDDFKIIGKYKAVDVFTLEERILNYSNEFHSYSPEYKGKKDWEMIRDRNSKFKMFDGNIVKA